MTKSYLKLLTLLIISIPLGCSLSFAQVDNNTLYKWKDSNGILHYSKIPPQEDTEIEVAKDSKIIFFEKPKEETVADLKVSAQEEKLKGKLLNCQSFGHSILETASAITKLNDKALQDKKMTMPEYTKEKWMITKLEDIGTDPDLTPNCLVDFVTQPEVKIIYDCIVDNNNPDDQRICLKKQIKIKE